MSPRLLVLAALLMGLLAGPVDAQEFRVTWDVDRSNPERARLTGRVLNQSSGDVFDVSVTAEALDQKGKVLARGISYVDSKIAQGDSRPFVAVVPAGPAATRFRVSVSSFRPGLSPQGP